MPASALDLPAIHTAFWNELAEASRGRDHSWRTPTLATQSADGPQARTVVLRDVCLEKRQLIFFTDLRSPKVHELRTDPRASLVFWSAALGWQLRLSCRVEAATDGPDVTARWAAIHHRRAAQDYLSPLAPGAVLPEQTGQPGRVDTPSEASDGVARRNFAVLIARVTRTDWLELRAGGHRRACWTADGGRWLAP